MLRVIFILIFLAVAGLIPFNYYDLVKYSVINFGTGWVFATLFIRFVVVVCFVLALNLIFSFFKRTEKLKFVWVFLIGMLPGFGISFITPIYNTDYGHMSDDLELEDIENLRAYNSGAYQIENERHIVAFFSTGCGHCQNVAAKIGINQMAGQEIEVHAFFIEEPNEIIEFLGQNYGQEFFGYQIKNQEEYMKYSGFELPSVYVIDRDGSTMKHWAGDLINYTALDYLAEMEP